MTQILQGIRVLEVAQWWFVPSAGAALRDWGAEIIKVEHPEEGDPQKRYAAVVTALDEAIGRVLDSLDNAKVTDNTFVFFYSDNGAFRLGRQGIDIGSNEPLREGGAERRLRLSPQALLTFRSPRKRH